MEIVGLETHDCISFNQLTPGETFIFGGTVFVCSTPGLRGTCLKDGTIQNFDASDAVERVEGRFMINHACRDD